MPFFNGGVVLSAEGGISNFGCFYAVGKEFSAVARYSTVARAVLDGRQGNG